MADLVEVVFSYLSTEPGVSGLVGTRIYPGKLMEGTQFPAIAWHRIDARRDRSYEPFDDFDAFVFTRLQFDAWADTYTGAVDVGDALLGALSGYGGMMAGTLLTAHAVNEFDDHDSLTKKFRRVLDFEVTYEESVKI